MANLLLKQLNTVISIKNLTKNFGRKIAAVDRISFDVYKNEVFGLIGPNGSGKTTTQRMLTMILNKSDGDIFFNQREILSNSDKNWVRKNIGYVPQGECLYRDLTVEENLEIFSKPYHLDSSQKQNKINELLNRLEIKNYRKTLIKNLSGGLVKRASIVAALVHSPRVVFFDEITMGLDPESRLCIWNLIKDLKKKSTVIITTHYMTEAEQLCDRVAILNKGKIVELASPESIKKKYQVKDLDNAFVKIIEQKNEQFIYNCIF